MEERLLSGHICGHALERDILELKKTYPGWALVAHTYNPSYSEGRDQKDGGLNSV
jgi:hypothetical protein